MKIYQIDAFTDVIFQGNPAAVCPLEDKWLPDEIMQSIASENNLSETAFYIKNNTGYEIRWFTPKVEVDLCGHATLATAHVLFEYEKYQGDSIAFKSKSGDLQVSKSDGYYTLDFPEDEIQKIKVVNDFSKCFSLQPIEAYKGKTDFMLVFNNEKEIVSMEINYDEIEKLSARGVIVTATGNDVDFVSRFFAPACGIREDPVTGSAHTSLVPYWSSKLQKNKLTAVQLSARRGRLVCEKVKNRIRISGNAKTYLIGKIFI